MRAASHERTLAQLQLKYGGQQTQTQYTPTVNGVTIGISSQNTQTKSVAPKDTHHIRSPQNQANKNQDHDLKLKNQALEANNQELKSSNKFLKIQTKQLKDENKILKTEISGK